MTPGPFENENGGKNRYVRKTQPDTVTMEEFTCEPCAFVVVIKNDGSEGGRYPLLDDTIIGR